MRFLLSLLVLFLAGWGAGATAVDEDKIPECAVISKLTGDDHGVVYHCAGCSFVVINNFQSVEIEVLRCDFDDYQWEGQ